MRNSTFSVTVSSVLSKKVSPVRLLLLHDDLSHLLLIESGTVVRVGRLAALLEAYGGAERVFALAAQIGFSVRVMKSVREKKPLWLLLAFVLHTLVDFGAAYAAGFLGDGASVWAIEVCVGLFAAAMLWFVWKEWKREKAQSAD